MKKYIIEILVLDSNHHIYVYERCRCNDLQECFVSYRFALDNYDSNEVRVYGYHIYQALESNYLHYTDFLIFEDDLD